MAEHQYQGRQPGRRPHSRPNRRNNNRNSQESGQGNRRYNRSGQKPQQPGKKPVSFWKKLLNFFGIGKSAAPQSKPQGKAPVKTNTRIARTQDQQPRPKKAPKMPTSAPRLYVGNLSYEATEADLEDLFKGIGSVDSVEIIYNPRTHKSKGYGFVGMRCMDDAYRAVEVLHEQPFMGRNLTVSAANERDLSDDRNDSREEDAQEESTGIKETVVPLVSEEEKA